MSNQRKDNYGGSLANRMRFVVEVAAAVREVWPKENLYSFGYQLLMGKVVAGH